MTTSKKSARPKFLEDEAYQALRTKHVHEGINALYTGRLGDIDASNNDAACQERQNELIASGRASRAAAKAAGLLDGFVALVDAYATAHTMDMAESQVKTVTEARGAADPAGYTDLVAFANLRRCECGSGQTGRLLL